MDNGIDRSIAERTASQLGLISFRQLDELGVSRSQRRSRCLRGHLVPVTDRVLRVAGAPRSWRQDVLAACLDVGGAAAYRTAAALHPLHGFRRRPQDPIEVIVSERRTNKTCPLAVVHATTTLDWDEDITYIGPIPVTTVARTFLGLAALSPPIPLEMVANAVDVAVRDGIADDAWLWWMLEHRRRSGRNGVMNLESILVDRAGLGRTESWLERQLLQVIDLAGLPRPKCQRRVRRHGAFAARVDFLYEEARLVIEVDGHGAHSTKAQRAADAERANRLQLAGYRVLRFTYDDVVRRPQVVIELIRAGLAP